MAAAGRGSFALACLVALAGIGAAYSNHFDNEFHFDDSHVIVDNLSIRSLHEPARFFTDPLTFSARPQNALYRPLLALSYAADYRIGGGLEPRAFHRTQFLMLLALGALLAALFRTLYAAAGAGPAARWAALAAATLFCIHTANTQTVNYLSARSDLGATLGVVAAFVVYLAWPRARPWQLHLLPALAGGLFKPLAVMYGPLLFVHVLLFEQQSPLLPPARAALVAALRRAGPALAAGLGLYLLLRRMEPETLEYAAIDRWTYARSQPFVWLHYLRLFLLPVGLTADTDWVPLERWWDVRLVAGGLFVAALAALVIRLARDARSRPVAFGLAWFALALLPSSSLFPLAEVYNEHRIFFPFVGLALAAVWAVVLGLERWARGRTHAAVAAALALALVTLAAHGAGTWVRNRAWHDDASLWSDVTRKSPGNPRGLMNYGLVLMRRGELAGALEHFERAAAIAPNYAVLEVNLGIVKSALGDPAEGEEHLQRALRLDPGYAQGHYYYARWLTERAKSPEAIGHLERALALSPGDAEAHRLLLEIHAARGDRPALAAHAQRVLRIAPSEPVARAYAAGGLPYQAADGSADGWARLAWEALERKAWLTAAVLYRRSLELDPTAAGVWNDLGWALAQTGFFEEALPCFERAVELDPALALARGNLAWAREGYPGAPVP